MKISLIAAVSRNGVIGDSGKLPWHIPEDLKFFKAKTKNHVIVMGRKTFESIGSKPLPSRLNIVVSRSEPAVRIERVFYCKSVTEAVELAKAKCRAEPQLWGDEIFICGGGEIYRQTIDTADCIYLTWIDVEVAGDAKFPEVPPAFREVARDARDGSPSYAFVTYLKK